MMTPGPARGGLVRRLLRNAAIDFFSWLGAFGLELAARLSGLDPDAAPERRLQAARSQRMVRNMQEHPCPVCEGLCVLDTPDGLELCGASDSYGVDLEWLARSVQL